MATTRNDSMVRKNVNAGEGPSTAPAPAPVPYPRAPTASEKIAELENRLKCIHSTNKSSLDMWKSRCDTKAAEITQLQTTVYEKGAYIAHLEAENWNHGAESARLHAKAFEDAEKLRKQAEEIARLERMVRDYAREHNRLEMRIETLERREDEGARLTRVSREQNVARVEEWKSGVEKSHTPPSSVSSATQGR